MSSSTQLDANQVIKIVFDDTTRAFSVTPSYVGTQLLINAAPAGTSLTSSAVNILPYKVTGVVVYWSGLNQADSTIQFQGSVDGNASRYENIGSPVTLTSASGHQSFSLIDEPYQYFQIVYTHGTNTTGTISASYIQRA